MRARLRSLRHATYSRTQYWFIVHISNSHGVAFRSVHARSLTRGQIADHQAQEHCTARCDLQRVLIGLEWYHSHRMDKLQP